MLPRRLGAYSPAWLDELCTSGELVWIGAGSRGRSDGRVALYFREDVRLAGPPPANAKLERSEGAAQEAIRERLAAGPSFWLDLLADLDLPAEELHNALWDLAWSGEVTNDAFAPLRAPRLRAVPSHERRGRRFARRRSAAGAAVQGRWSLTAPLFADAPGAGPRLRAQAELMLERYGIVTRETVLAEGVPGGFSTLYAELGNLELLGTARRGYFVEGLGGAQFALPGAVERLRSLPEAGRLLPAARRHRSGQPLRRRAALAEAAPRAAARPAPPAPTSCSATASRWSTSSAAAAASSAWSIWTAPSWQAPRRPSPTPSPAGRLPKLADREARRRAGDRLRPRGGSAQRRLQPRPTQAHRRGRVRPVPVSRR